MRRSTWPSRWSHPRSSAATSATGASPGRTCAAAGPPAMDEASLASAQAEIARKKSDLGNLDDDDAEPPNTTPPPLAAAGPSSATAAGPSQLTPDNDMMMTEAVAPDVTDPTADAPPPIVPSTLV